MLARNRSWRHRGSSVITAWTCHGQTFFVRCKRSTAIAFVPLITDDSQKKYRHVTMKGLFNVTLREKKCFIFVTVFTHRELWWGKLFFLSNSTFLSSIMFVIITLYACYCYYFCVRTTKNMVGAKIVILVKWTIIFSLSVIIFIFIVLLYVVLFYVILLC